MSFETVDSTSCILLSKDQGDNINYLHFPFISKAPSGNTLIDVFVICNGR